MVYIIIINKYKILGNKILTVNSGDSRGIMAYEGTSLNKSYTCNNLF